MPPRWLTAQMVMALHAEQMRQFGGDSGLRDRGLLESALDRPRNRYAYDEDSSLFALAAAYCHGIVGNHPFVDGNKRTGFIAAHVFIELNGHRFAPPETEVVAIIVALAAGELDEVVLEAWFARHARRKS